MRFLLILIVMCAGMGSNAQSGSLLSEKRKPQLNEIRQLSHLADSFQRSLKQLYKLEIKENSPKKYQPERIALVRSYLLLFQHMEQTCGIVAYSKSHVQEVFGKPDSVFVNEANQNEEVWVYEHLNKNYIRINNLKYRFLFRRKELVTVKRG